MAVETATKHTQPGLIDLVHSEVPNPRMRVLFVTNVWPDELEPHWGVFVRSQARSLEIQGVAVDVAVVRGPRSRKAYVLAPRAIYGLSRAATYDVVHVHAGHTLAVSWTTRRPLVVSFFGADLLGKPTEHGLEKQSHFEALVFRQLARFADATITKSEEMEKTLPKSVRRTNSVIPNGVDVEALRSIPKAQARTRLGWEQDDKVALFLCDEQDPRKNFGLAAAATRLAAASLPNIRLHSDFGLPHDEVRLLLSASDCLVFPSRGEGSPNLVKEAMAAALPIVATPVGDIPERLLGVDGCFVVEPLVEEFAAAIVLAAQLDRAPAAREAIMSLSIDAVAIRVLNVYREVVSRRRHPQPAPLATDSIGRPGGESDPQE